MSQIRLAIADDHELFRETLSQYLDQSNSLCVVHKAKNGKGLLQKLSSAMVDVVILDLNMPILDGKATLKCIRELYGATVRVIMLSAQNHVLYLKRMMRAGANAYMDKGCELHNLVDAIGEVHRKGIYFYPKHSADLINEIKYGTGDETAALHGESLSERESEILKLLCSGLSCPQIAAKIFLSKRTIENHKHKIFKKLCVGSPTSMMEAAIRCGYYVIDM